MRTGRIRLVELGDDGVEVQCDLGGGENATADHYGPPGDDSRPLPGDDAALVDGAGEGNQQAVGYDDDTTRKATNGEVRRYSRNSSGTVVAEIWLKGDGSIEIASIASGSTVTINGVVIDQQGNVSTPGEVTAKDSSAPVTLSQHTHNTAVGPTAVPSPEIP